MVAVAVVLSGFAASRLRGFAPVSPDRAIARPAGAVPTSVGIRRFTGGPGKHRSPQRTLTSAAGDCHDVFSGRRVPGTGPSLREILSPRVRPAPRGFFV